MVEYYQKLLERESSAMGYLASVDARKGLPYGTSARRAAPPVLLTLPIKIPHDVLKRIVESFVPRDMPAPRWTRLG